MRWQRTGEQERAGPTGDDLYKAKRDHSGARYPGADGDQPVYRMRDDVKLAEEAKSTKHDLVAYM